jgi:hypothetical protein
MELFESYFCVTSRSGNVELVCRAALECISERPPREFSSLSLGMENTNWEKFNNLSIIKNQKR